MNSLDNDFVFPVYIYKQILEQITALCTESPNEIFGYLVGMIFEWKEQRYLIIEDQICVENAIKSEKFKTSQKIGTAGAFEKKFNQIKITRNNEGLLIVGWWHSHIGVGSFLSPTDVLTQEIFFPRAQQVALVIDPIQNKTRFFRLDTKSVKKYKAISYAVISRERDHVTS